MYRLLRRLVARKKNSVPVSVLLKNEKSSRKLHMYLLSATSNESINTPTVIQADSKHYRVGVIEVFPAPTIDSAAMDEMES